MTCGGPELTYWDYNAKSRLKVHNFQNKLVSCASTSPCGDYTAYAFGYDYQRGIDGIYSYEPSIKIHKVAYNEKTKQWRGHDLNEYIVAYIQIVLHRLFASIQKVIFIVGGE